MTSIEQLKLINDKMIELIKAEKKAFSNKETFITFIKNNFENYYLYVDYLLPIYNRHSDLNFTEKNNNKKPIYKKNKLPGINSTVSFFEENFIQQAGQPWLDLNLENETNNVISQTLASQIDPSIDNLAPPLPMDEDHF